MNFLSTKFKAMFTFRLVWRHPAPVPEEHNCAKANAIFNINRYTIPEWVFSASSCYLYHHLILFILFS